MALASEQPQQWHESLRAMSTTLDNTILLTERLLQLSAVKRKEQGERQFSPVNLFEVVQTSCFTRLAQARSKGIDLGYEGVLEAIWIDGDDVLLGELSEVVNQVCFKVIGNDITVTMASEAGQLQLNVMEPVIGQAMFESIHILSNACYNLLEKCVNGITANKEVCEGYVYNSIGIVTYLNPFIGHHNGDIVGKICAETGKSVREVVLERGLLTEAELDDIFSAQNLMHPAYKAKRYTDENEQ